MVNQISKIEVQVQASW